MSLSAEEVAAVVAELQALRGGTIREDRRPGAADGLPQAADSGGHAPAPRLGGAGRGPAARRRRARGLAAVAAADPEPAPGPRPAVADRRDRGRPGRSGGPAGPGDAPGRQGPGGRADRPAREPVPPRRHGPGARRGDALLRRDPRTPSREAVRAAAGAATRKPQGAFPAIPRRGGRGRWPQLARRHRLARRPGRNPPPRPVPISAAIDEAYGPEVRAHDLARRKREASKPIAAALVRAERTLKKLGADDARAADAERLRVYGDLLKPHLHAIPGARASRRSPTGRPGRPARSRSRCSPSCPPATTSNAITNSIGASPPPGTGSPGASTR